MNENELLHAMKKKKYEESNLKDYVSLFANHYHTYANIQLAFSYYMEYELLAEETDQAWISDYTKTFNEALLLDGQEAIVKVNGLRDQVMKTMDRITLYTDALSIYEHILNRVEYRFQENETPDLSYAATKMEQFIFADKDAVITNDKVKKIVSELPLRMTKQRFYDILSDSIGIYKDSEESAVEGFLYMIRTTAMLHDDFSEIAGVSGLKEFKDTCMNTDFTSIDEATYKNLVEQLHVFGDELTKIVNIYMQLQECINHYYTILLCKPYMTEISEASKTSQAMIHHILDQYEADDPSVVLNGCNAYLEALEGKQEAIMEKLMKYEAILSDVSEGHMDQEGIKDLTTCEKLVSSSIFINLEEENQSPAVTPAFLEQETKGLLEDFATFFKGHSQVVNRAVMSTVLGVLPVFFNSSKEIKEYIDYALEHCSDQSELCASVDIINQIME